MKLSTLLLPLTITPEGGLQTVSGRDRVLQGVALYFGTPLGSRCMVPEFGYPPLNFYEGDVRGWVQDVENGLRLLGHIKSAQLNVTLNEHGILEGTAMVQTDAGEEVEYAFTLDAA